MAAKKIKNELESVRGDIRELAEAVWALRDQLTTEQAVAAAERQTRHDRQRPNGQVTGLDGVAAMVSEPAHVSLAGTFQAPGAADSAAAGMAYQWALRDVPIGSLIEAPIDARAQLLAAIGHRQRLGILLHLLTQPSTATELVASLSLGTTGAAYHHINVLQAAGLVEQRQRGIFAVVPRRVPTLLTILASLSDAIELEVAPVDAPEAEEATVAGFDDQQVSKKGKKKGG